MTSPQLSFKERANLATNPLHKKIFNLMQDKKTNLALSADVTSCKKLLTLADKIGPEICVLKTHVDILEDFTLSFTNDLKKLAEKHQFLIFEDRKFADIGNTVKQQYQGGIYRIADWADMINAHSLPGPSIVSGLAEIGMPKDRGLLLLAEMSSENNLVDEPYTQKTLALAEQFPEFVLGFIAQQKLNGNPRWLYMTPGVRFAEGKDALGQQYNTPEKAIIENGTDIIIVGRGIINANEPTAIAKKYRQAAWEAYESLFRNSH